MIDKRLAFVDKDSSFVALKRHIENMLDHHGFYCDHVEMQPGLFYDTADWGVHFHESKNAYTVNVTTKISEIDKAPKKIEAAVLDMLATTK